MWLQPEPAGLLASAAGLLYNDIAGRYYFLCYVTLFVVNFGFGKAANVLRVFAEFAYDKFIFHSYCVICQWNADVNCSQSNVVNWGKPCGSANPVVM